MNATGERGGLDRRGPFQERGQDLECDAVLGSVRAAASKRRSIVPGPKAAGGVNFLAGSKVLDLRSEVLVFVC